MCRYPECRRRLSKTASGCRRRRDRTGRARCSRRAARSGRIPGMEPGRRQSPATSAAGPAGRSKGLQIAVNGTADMREVFPPSFETINAFSQDIDAILIFGIDAQVAVIIAARDQRRDRWRRSRSSRRRLASGTACPRVFRRSRIRRAVARRDLHADAAHNGGSPRVTFFQVLPPSLDLKSPPLVSPLS